MSKKLGLENKYKQFIKPTKLKEYKSVMGKIQSESAKLNALKSANFFKKRINLAGGATTGSAFKKFLNTVGVYPLIKKHPIGKAVSAISKLRKSSLNKKMGGGMMMKYSKGNDVKLSPKQKKIAAMAGDPTKIDAPDFKKLKSMKKKNE